MRNATLLIPCVVATQEVQKKKHEWFCGSMSKYDNSDVHMTMNTRPSTVVIMTNGRALILREKCKIQQRCENKVYAQKFMLSQFCHQKNDMITRFGHSNLFENGWYGACARFKLGVLQPLQNLRFHFSLTCWTSDTWWPPIHPVNFLSQALREWVQKCCITASHTNRWEWPNATRTWYLKTHCRSWDSEIHMVGGREHVSLVGGPDTPY